MRRTPGNRARRRAGACRRGAGSVPAPRPRPAGSPRRRPRPAAAPRSRRASCSTRRNGVRSPPRPRRRTRAPGAGPPTPGRAAPAGPPGRLVHQRPGFVDRRPRASLLLLAGQEHPDPAGGGPRVGQQRTEPLRQGGGLVDRTPCVRAGLHQDVQSHDERCGARFRPVHVDMDGHGLVHSLGEPTGGGEHVVDGALPDTRNLPQPVGARFENAAQGAQSALLDAPQAQPTFGDVLQPGHGDGVELPLHRLVVDRLQCRPYRLHRPSVVIDHGPRGLVESCSPRDGVPLATPHTPRPSPALPASCHRPHRPRRAFAAHVTRETPADPASAHPAPIRHGDHEGAAPGRRRPLLNRTLDEPLGAQ